MVQKMASYSIHVIVEYNQAGSEIIYRQIYNLLHHLLYQYIIIYHL